MDVNFDIIVVLTVLVKSIDCVTVELSSDGPGLTDLPITFTARVDGDSSMTEYYYVFEDLNSWPPIRNEILAGREANYTVVFSKDTSVGDRRMRVQVFAYIWGFKGWLIAENVNKFRIQNSLVMEISLSQSGLSPKAKTNSVVAANRAVELNGVIKDVSRTLNSSTIYTWNLDERTFGPTSSPLLNYTFQANKTYSIQLTVMSNITFGGKIITKLGNNVRKITAKNEIKVMNVTGNTYLKDGSLLELEVKCSGGDPPFWYCYDFFKTKRDNYSCDHEMFETNECYFPITHYFPRNGTHFLEIGLYNDVNFQHKSIQIKVYEIVRRTQLTFVIIPIMSSILAIIIIVVGIAYHLQKRHNYNITLEVADFDFEYNDNLIEKTFFERLRESLATAMRDTFFYPCNPCTRAANYDDLIDDSLPEETIRNNNQRAGINTNPISYGISK